MILPFPIPEPGEQLTSAEGAGLEAFRAGHENRLRVLRQLVACDRDGHRPAARWRGATLRCFRCQRCGAETQP